MLIVVIPRPLPFGGVVGVIACFCDYIFGEDILSLKDSLNKLGHVRSSPFSAINSGKSRDKDMRVVTDFTEIVDIFVICVSKLVILNLLIQRIFKRLVAFLSREHIFIF